MSAGSALQERIVLLFNIRGAVSAVCSIINATFSVSNRTDCAPGNKSQVKIHLSRCCCCINWHRERQLFNCLVKKMTLSPKGSGDTTDMHSFQFVVGFFCLAHFLADAIEKQNMILTCNYMGIMHVFGSGSVRMSSDMKLNESLCELLWESSDCSEGTYRVQPKSRFHRCINGWNLGS